MSLVVNIEKQLGNFHLHVDFTAENEVLALLGASGSGKSVTLKCIAGLMKPDTGYIELNGRVLFDSKNHINLSPQQRRVGYLFQQYALFPQMTVAQNIATGIRQGTKEEKAAIVRREVARLGLQGLEHKRPHQLSGGQQQRVALGRILVNKPEILLLDEPFSALDSHLRYQLEQELSDTLTHFGGVSLFVSHARDEVYRLSDSVCVLTNGRSEGKMETKELFTCPRTISAAQLTGCKNIAAAARIDAHHVHCADWGVTLQTARPVAHCAAVGVRAHHIHTAATGEENVFSCTVVRVIDDMFSTVVLLQTPGGGLLQMERDKSVWGPGDTVNVSITPDFVMTLE